MQDLNERTNSIWSELSIVVRLWCGCVFDLWTKKFLVWFAEGMSHYKAQKMGQCLLMTQFRQDRLIFARIDWFGMNIGLSMMNEMAYYVRLNLTTYQ